MITVGITVYSMHRDSHSMRRTIHRLDHFPLPSLSQHPYYTSHSAWYNVWYIQWPARKLKTGAAKSNMVRQRINPPKSYCRSWLVLTIMSSLISTATAQGTSQLI